MAGQKSSFDLEPNPFEKSFAEPKTGTSLRLPTISSNSPPILTPGGRRLPPLLGSPSLPNPASNPATPGSLWNSLLNATGNPGPTNNNNNNTSSHTNGHTTVSSFVNTLRKSGLTPNESNLRSGMTPGSAYANINLPGINTAAGLINGPITPGLSSLLSGINQQPADYEFSDLNGQAHHNLLQPTQQQPIQPANSVPRSELSDAAESPSKRDLAEDDDDDEDDDEDDEDDDEPAHKRVKKENTSELKTPGRKRRAPLTEDQKRKNFLERNRVAASKCRQRKKQLFQKMEDELQFYSTSYRELNSEVNTLREQVLTLRTVLFAHKECPMLVDNVGGVGNLNNLLNATNYQMNSANANTTTLPTTIPTTLNEVKTVAPMSQVHHSVPTTTSNDVNLVNGGVALRGDGATGLLAPVQGLVPLHNRMP